MVVAFDAADPFSSCFHRLHALGLMSNPLPAALTAETRTLSGGGRTNPITAQVVQPSSVGQLQDLVRCAPPRAH